MFADQQEDCDVDARHFFQAGKLGISAINSSLLASHVMRPPQ
jgi:hypothetical protein